MSKQNSLLGRMRRVLGRTAEESVTYRVTLKRESDADRAAYIQRAASLTDGLEASIRDASSGSFELIDVSRTGGPYSRTMAAIDEEEQRLMELNARLDALGETGSLWSSASKDDLISEREKAARSLDELLHHYRHRTANTFAYRVSFAPKLPSTVEPIVSEFGRLSTLDGVDTVELESDASDDDPRASIDFRGRENQDR